MQLPSERDGTGRPHGYCVPAPTWLLVNMWCRADVSWCRAAMRKVCRFSPSLQAAAHASRSTVTVRCAPCTEQGSLGRHTVVVARCRHRSVGRSIPAVRGPHVRCSALYKQSAMSNHGGSGISYKQGRACKPALCSTRRQTLFQLPTRQQASNSSVAAASQGGGAPSQLAARPAANQQPYTRLACHMTCSSLTSTCKCPTSIGRSCPTTGIG